MLKLKRFTRVGQLDGVTVYLHWSTIVLSAAVVLLAPTRLALTLTALASYFAVTLLHEWGHVLAARGRRCQAWSIELYPICGCTRISAPHSRMDDCVIAWGGVMAQMALAVPLVLLVSRTGFKGPDVVNTVVAFLGHFSMLIAVFNLAPVPPLDGHKAWRVIPILFGRLMNFARQRRRKSGPRRRRAPWEQ